MTQSADDHFLEDGRKTGGEAFPDTLTLKLLEVEYDKLQAAIDKCDDQRFKIKGWSITVAGALFVLGVNANNSWLVVAGAVAAVLFGYLEIVFVQIQLRIISRSNEIESRLDSARRGVWSKVDEGYSFGISHAIMGYFEWSAVPKTLSRRPHITVFHVSLVLAMLTGAAVLAWS
jgi:hypothetical protein